ncbi:hypothetical protein E4U47_001716 [Claviceps purpurea]|nr:hypothetical protein E4U47_001716 [Claviceps purpurea]
MEFSRCVVIQHVCDSDFANPVIHFMAVLGIHANRGTLREDQDYSPILAGLVYCVRVISLELLLPSKGLRGIPEIQNFTEERRKYVSSRWLDGPAPFFDQPARLRKEDCQEL